MLTYHQMTETEAKLISGWQYPGEYAIYNMPPYEEQKAGKFGFANPERAKNFYSYFDGNTLVGFTNILEEEKEIFIGIGVNPEICGKGYGQRILALAAEISSHMNPDKSEYLEVRSWNVRAVRCYEKAGFQIEGAEFEQKTSIGTGKFYRMVRTK